MAVAAFLTGNPAEKVVENIPDVAKSLVSRHEDIASVGMYLLIPTGILAALTLYSIWKKEKSVKFLVIITLILSLISSIAMVFVGRTGGQIRHTEFHNESVKQYIIQHKNDVEED
jgi:riboflavin transporter FmnP